MLIGALAAFCFRIWPRERLLLQRATRITTSENFERWVSDHEIVGCNRAYDEPPGTVLYTDLNTGSTLKFPVRKFIRESHAQLMASPDGRWALSWEGIGPGPGDRVTATELRTGRTLSWPSVGDAYHYDNYWMPDGKRWLQGTTLPKGYLILT